MCGSITELPAKAEAPTDAADTAGNALYEKAAALPAPAAPEVDRDLESPMPPAIKAVLVTAPKPRAPNVGNGLTVSGCCWR